MSDMHGPSTQALNAAALFAGERLTLARQLAGLRKSDLAAQMDKSGTAVTSWETGRKRPTPATVAQLALTLGVEPGFFAVRPEDIAATSTPPHFRSLRSTTQIARDQAYSYGKLAVDIAATLERHVEFPERDVPSWTVAAENGDDGPERAAQLVRQEWALGDGPLKHLIRLLERHGILVVFSPPQTASVDAYSFDNVIRPIVVLNPVKRDYYRQRFDVAHELGHLVMHADAEPGGRVVEDQAHRFAAELLAPTDSIFDDLPSTMGPTSWARLGRLKENWGISIQALLYRARRLGRLSDVSYRNAMVTVSSRGWRRDEPGLVTSIERPSLLPQAVELLEDAGVTEQELVRQAGVPSELFGTVCGRMPEFSVVAEEQGRKVVSLLDWKGRRDG